MKTWEDYKCPGAKAHGAEAAEFAPLRRYKKGITENQVSGSWEGYREAADANEVMRTSFAIFDDTKIRDL